jgi:hypothetical protein
MTHNVVMGAGVYGSPERGPVGPRKSQESLGRPKEALGSMGGPKKKQKRKKRNK